MKRAFFLFSKLGALRFRPPIKNEPWNGIRNATNGHHWCAQIWYSGMIGDEDCLYVNVYTPYTNFTEIKPSLPVMVISFKTGGYRTFF